jgi:hypothetical protein
LALQDDEQHSEAAEQPWPRVVQQVRVAAQVSPLQQALPEQEEPGWAQVAWHWLPLQVCEQQSE